MPRLAAGRYVLEDTPASREVVAKMRREAQAQNARDRRERIRAENIAMWLRFQP